ncbi:MAG: 4-aminobutyrate--pyruvate transaminase [Parasphingorhabdus sp.]|jgi:4-aminobutyrate--pyruvate transaminase
MTRIVYPTTNLAATEQMCIESGSGVYVYDDKGNQYLEGLASLWCTSLGYGNKELISAISDQLEKLSFSHMFGGKTHTPGMQLADTLAAMVPVDDARIFFGNSGSDANDSHIKLLHYYFNAIGKPEKKKIITRERAYHGVTVAAGSLTSLPVNLGHFDAPVDALNIIRTDAPHYYHGKLEGESESEFVTRIVGNLEKLILEEGPETIAAMIMEPITGASGVIVPPDGYYQQVETLLRKHDILVWSDEVITGFGRTGNDFGCTTMGFKPDLMTFAKQLSSAYYPISASVIPGFMHDAIIDQSAKAGVFGHGYTYSGHPVGCAVALKVLEIYQRDDTFTTAAKVGEYLQWRLKEFNEHPLVGEVRGRGLIAAVELVADKATGTSFNDGVVGAFAQNACQNNGLLIRAVAGNSLGVCPPMIITETQIDELVSKMSRALDEAYDFAVNDGRMTKSPQQQAGSI